MYHCLCCSTAPLAVAITVVDKPEPLLASGGIHHCFSVAAGTGTKPSLDELAALIGASSSTAYVPWFFLLVVSYPTGKGAVTR